MDGSTMTIEEIKKHLRKDYGKWPWQKPTKEDRLQITEEQWAQIDWTPEEIERNCALPHKMWNMRSDDQVWPLCYRWRGDSAYGYRAGEGHAKFMPELPQLVEGRGIARWMARHDTSVVEVPEFADYRQIWRPDNLPQVIEFYERKGENPHFGQKLTMPKEEFLATYSPTPLQKFSKRSKLLLDPHHYSWHRMIQQNEHYTGDDFPDWVVFYRIGARMDSFDSYYVLNAFYFGLHWN